MSQVPTLGAGTDSGDVQTIPKADAASKSNDTIKPRASPNVAHVVVNSLTQCSIQTADEMIVGEAMRPLL